MCGSAKIKSQWHPQSPWAMAEGGRPHSRPRAASMSLTSADALLATTRLRSRLPPPALPFWCGRPARFLLRRASKGDPPPSAPLCRFYLGWRVTTSLAGDSHEQPPAAVHVADEQQASGADHQPYPL